MTERAGWIVINDELELRADHRGEAGFVHGTGGRPDRPVARPSTVEVKIHRAGEPQVYARVDVTSKGTQLVELRFTAEPGGRGVRRSDLRNVDLDLLLEDYVAAAALELHTAVLGTDPTQWADRRGRPAEDDVLRFARKLRHGRQREVNPNLLERVAEVYRANIDGFPTKAVGQEFQVSSRMATEYVSRARKRGFLPPTKQGKKQA